MIYIKEYPSQEIIKNNFEYIDGRLYRKTKKGLSPVGSWTRQGYESFLFNCERYATHRIIFIYHRGDISSNCEIDHKDGNTLNNKIDNLRLSVRKQNVRNSSLQSNNTSGIKGVSWNKDRNVWMARLGSGKNRIEKSFKNIDDAEKFLRSLRIQLHGEFHNHG